jgi:DNA-binding NarL/FixJ family response regulator
MPRATARRARPRGVDRQRRDGYRLTTEIDHPMLNDCASVPRDSKHTSTCVNGREVRRLREIHILVCHSDPLIAAGLEAVLSRRSDLKILIPGQGNEVARAGKEHVADVVIADYESGLRLSSTGRESRRRILILTHTHSEAQICRALERGVRGYLLLGCSSEELYDGIRSVYQGGVALGPQVACRIAENMKQRALTEREQGVLRQLMLGLSNKQIGNKFMLSEGTVKAHVKSIFAKLHARSRTEAIAIAHRRGLLA